MERDRYSILRRRNFVALVLLLVVGCKSEEPVIKVGNHAIFKRDIEDQKKINQAMGGGEQIDALQQLIDVFTQAAVLEKNGFDLSAAALNKESDRIDRNTQDSATLKSIKAVFGNRHEDYLRTFVLPTLAKRSIFFEFYARNEKIHAKTILDAQQFQFRARSIPNGFLAVAKSEDRQIRKIEIASDDPQDKWTRRLYEGLQPGEVSTQMVDTPEAIIIGWRPPHTENKLEVVAFPKRPFDDWYSAEKTNVDVVKTAPQ